MPSSKTLLAPARRQCTRIAPHAFGSVPTMINAAYDVGDIPNTSSTRISTPIGPPTVSVVSKGYPFQWSVVALLAAGAILTYPFDVFLAKFFLSDPFPGEVRSLIHKAEFFGHAYGIMGIAFTIYLICENRRPQLPRLLFTALAAGLACDAVKMLVHRVRPVDFSYAADQATFKGLSFLHASSVSQFFDSSYHSFPSAHTATAIAFAMALGAMFPTAARWFLAVAVTCAVSRFDGGAHYVSDTFVGAILGYAVACWMLGKSSISRRFATYEQIWFARQTAAKLEIAEGTEPRVTYSRERDRYQALKKSMM